MPTPSEVPDFYPDLQCSLVLAYSLGVPRLTLDPRGLWFLPTRMEVPYSFLDPQRSWLKPKHSVVPVLHPDPQMSLVLVYILSGCSLLPAPVDYAVSVLHRLMSLAHACFYKYLCSGPDPMEAHGLGTVP